MTQAFLAQVAASAAAVMALVALAAWAKIGRPAQPLDDARARALLSETFPGRTLDNLWISMDGKGALARSGALALVVCALGEGFVCRQIPWALALSASYRDGRLIVDLADVGAPRAVIAFPSWPPEGLEKSAGAKAAA